MKKSLMVIVSAMLGLTLAARPVMAVTNPVITGEYPYYSFVEDPENPWESVWEPLDATGTYEYTDDYFKVVSPGIHANLRTMSYALALAGYENAADGYPNESGVANPKLQKMLGELGFSDYKYWDAASDIDGHSMGTSIAHKRIAYETNSGEESKELIVVAPRNYNYLNEWLSNFDVGASGDHEGFTESANLVLGRLNQYIADYGLTNYKIWIVGYSRGGAVVDLVGKKINENLGNYSMGADDLYAYTFGAPRGSVTEPKYSNIHDVKDGNDLLLGYLFPEAWGFYNTGVYEEIHPADLVIPETVINTEALVDPARVTDLLVNNDGTVETVGEINGKKFMDEFLAFVIDAGVTREYFNSAVRPALSRLMKVYQSRTIDKQSEVLNFIKDQSTGMLGRLAGNIILDLMTTIPGDTLEEKLMNYPLYLDLVKAVDGTATEAEINEVSDYLYRYVGTYDQYTDPAVTETEFTEIKEALPDLVRALGPVIVADAKYTVENYGENRSLYFMSTLVANAETLVIGHIPESIMPILKTYTDPEEEMVIPLVPNTGGRCSGY